MAKHQNTYESNIKKITDFFNDFQTLVLTIDGQRELESSKEIIEQIC